jgi:hypothetical protein
LLLLLLRGSDTRQKAHRANNRDFPKGLNCWKHGICLQFPDRF